MKKDEYIFIINGNIKFIEEINKKIESFDLKKVSIVDCYNAEKINLKDINKKYDYKLNTEEV